MIIPTPHPERHRLETIVLEPFAETERHAHPVDVTLVVLDGWVRAWLDGRWYWLARGDDLLIPAGASHLVAIGARRSTLGLINRATVIQSRLETVKESHDHAPTMI